jgi:hypothetical protein
MIQPTPGTIPTDKDAERRRALAKIYSLLIKLAEDSSVNESATDTTATKDENKTSKESDAKQLDLPI